MVMVLITNQLKEIDHHPYNQPRPLGSMTKQTVLNNDTVHDDDCFTNHCAVMRCV